MSAKDVIARAVQSFYDPFPDGYVGEVAKSVADDILAKLTAAGYRILGPGELDPVTVERCAKYHDDQADGYRAHDPMPGEDSYEFQIRFHECSAGQIRSLSPTQPEAKEARDGR